jgi:hypothetical protein
MRFVVDNIAVHAAPGGLSLVNAASFAEVRQRCPPFPIGHVESRCSWNSRLYVISPTRVECIPCAPPTAAVCRRHPRVGEAPLIAVAYGDTFTAYARNATRLSRQCLPQSSHTHDVTL